MFRFFECVDDEDHVAPNLRDAIDRFRGTSAEALGYDWVDEVIPEVLQDYIASRTREIEDIQEDYQEYVEGFFVSGGGTDQIVLLGHTHVFDWNEGTDEVYANTDTWVQKFRFNEVRTGHQTRCELRPADGPRHPFVVAFWKPAPGTGEGGSPRLSGKVEVRYYYFSPTLTEVERAEINVRV